MSVVLSIIIVNWNGTDLLDECLESIHTFVHSEDTEVIVVDNASQDDSVNLMRTYYPWVTIVESRKNLGFAGGNNLGFKYAKGEYLLLLNNDTRLLSSLKSAIQRFNANPKLVALGCLMRTREGNFRPSFGYFPTLTRLIVDQLMLNRLLGKIRKFGTIMEKDMNLYGVSREVEWISGAFLMTRRDIWEQLGGLDESYFMYMEDVDYCKSCWLKGYTVEYTPEVEIVHYGRSGLELIGGWKGEQPLILSRKGLRIYHHKYSSPVVRILVWSVLTLGTILRTSGYWLRYLRYHQDVDLMKCQAYSRSLPSLFTSKDRSIVV